MIDLYPIAAFNDNYIWALFDERGACLIVDPGQAAPVLAFLQREDLTLTGILITHHHGDHVGGIADLLAHADVPVYGPAGETIPYLTHPLEDDAALHFDAPLISARVMAVPGHTAGHIAYYFAHCEPAVLFPGDTLFSGGCGRLFEGTPAQMLTSLQRLAALPDSTRICCAHEYTQANLRFAQAVTPQDVAVAQRVHDVAVMRSEGHPSLPSTLAIEKASNPFLRIHDTAIRQRLLARGCQDDDISLFAELRAWKDSF